MIERSLLRQLTRSNVEAYVNRAREAYLKTMFWQQFFPLKYTTQLTWESLSGSGGNPVMADVVEYNATAPLKTRRVVAKASGDIPKIALKRKMDEKDFNDYNTISAGSQGDANKTALLDIVFNDIDFCLQGVLARTEFLAMQALSYGSIALTDSNNNGIITKTSVDFGIPSGNKTAASINWATAASAVPITDIQAIVDSAKDAGYSINFVVMDRAAVRLMLATTEVKDKYAFFQRISASRKADVALADFNAMMEAYMLPQVVVVDSSVRFESTAHALSTVAPWKAGYIALIPELKVGNFLHGPIAEETSETLKKIAIMVKNQHVLLTKWSEVEPFGEYTKGQANAFPRFTDVNSIFLMKHNATSWS